MLSVRSEDGWSLEAGAVFESLITDRALEAMVVGYAEDGTPFVNLYSIQSTEVRPGTEPTAMSGPELRAGGSGQCRSGGGNGGLSGYRSRSRSRNTPKPGRRRNSERRLVRGSHRLC